MRRFFWILPLAALLFGACELIDREEDGDGYVPESYLTLLDANCEEVGEVLQIMKGVVADGDSQIEVAIPYYADNEIVALSIEELTEAWGSWSEISEPILKNNFHAYRVVLTSSESLPTALQAGDCAVLEYEFSVTTEDGVTQSYQTSIEVVRPPALFVHGLASNAATYDPIFSVITPMGLYLDGALYAADYSTTCMASYDTNKDVVPDGILHLRELMLESGIVCDRVSVVGHSMGGILSRMYMQGRSSEEYRDDIHKLICIDTPHSGSQLADFAIALGESNPDGIIDELATMGAIVDLAVASDATAELNSTENLAVENALDIPTHLITAHIGTLTDVAELVKDDEIFKAIVTYALNAIGENRLYNGDTSDIVVPTESQKGGVSSGIRDNYISIYSNEWHCSVLTSQEVAEDIADLLDAATTSNYFTTDGFDPPLLSYDSTISQE